MDGKEEGVFCLSQVKMSYTLKNAFKIETLAALPNLFVPFQLLLHLDHEFILPYILKFTPTDINLEN